MFFGFSSTIYLIHAFYVKPELQTSTSPSLINQHEVSYIFSMKTKTTLAYTFIQHQEVNSLEVERETIYSVSRDTGSYVHG